MGYYLAKTSANASARIDLNSSVTFMREGTADYTGDWELYFEVELTGSSLVLLSQDTSQATRILFFTSTTSLELRRPASSDVTFTLPVSAAGRHTYRIIGRSNTNDIEVFQDEVSCGTAPSSDLFFVQNFFTFSNTSRLANLYSCKFYNNGTLIHDLDPSASNGTGSTLPDTVGTNDGTLNDFPTDDSQWVFYSTGTTEDALTAQNLQAQTSTTTATLTQSHQLAPASLQAATSTTSATLAQVHALTPVSLISASNTTTGALTQAHTLAPTDLASTTTTNTPALTQIHTLIPASLTSQSSTTNTSLSDQSTVDNLTANSLQASTSTNTPAFTQAHSITASDTASATNTSTPTLAQVHTLNPQGVTASTSTSTATLQSIAGQDSLAATDLAASTSTTTGTLAQIHVLTPQSLAAGTSTTTASIAQVHGLAASNVISITSTTSPILRNASVVLARPIINTKAAAIQATYKATAMTAERKAVTIQADYKVGVS